MRFTFDYVLDVSSFCTHLERLRRNGDARLSSEVWNAGPLRYGQRERVQQAGEEEEELGFGQDVAQAHPPPHAERNEVVGFDDFGAVGAEEPLRIEHFRILPQGRVHVNGVNQRDHLGAFRYGEPVQRCRSGR